MKRSHAFCVAMFAAITLVRCSNDAASGGNGTFPLVTPPVRAAAPAGLQARTLDPAEFSSRFFTTGPTSIFNILTAIDNRITDINSRTNSSHECASQTPVAYTIPSFSGNIAMFAQCYEMIGGSLVQWGEKDGSFYLYSGIGATHVAAIATPVVGTDKYIVEAWMGVGYTNATCGGGYWDTCSYGVLHLIANSNTNEFEMTVAGIGFGYCGAQIKSDGTNVYAEGSTDMGTTCNTTDTLCVTAADPMVGGSCGGAVGTFSLAPLGRVASTGSGHAVAASWGLSDYPAVPTVTLDGTANDALDFGPATATVGVGAF